MFNKTSIALGLTLSLASVNASALVITTTDNADVLANAILGSGITISNATYTGAANQSGTFTDGGAIGMDTGIILTSGNANNAVGPNNSGSTGSFTGSGSDADLGGLIPGFSTNDAAILEFDFETSGGDLFFEFVFASEEYNEFVDTAYNDVYGFFVDGVNIALAPNGDVASIDSINCGNPFSGAGPNCDAYNNNEDGVFDIEYDGFTDVLVAELLGHGAGDHSIKIAIADAGDSDYDSAVFIKGGTFSDTQPGTEPPGGGTEPPNGGNEPPSGGNKPPQDVPEPGILALLGIGLAGMAIMRRRKQI